mgnify:CR=1 FL=1
MHNQIKLNKIKWNILRNIKFHWITSKSISCTCVKLISVESVRVSTGAENNLRKKLLTSAGIEWNVSSLHRRVTGFKRNSVGKRNDSRKITPEVRPDGGKCTWEIPWRAMVSFPPISRIFSALPQLPVLIRLACL